MTTADSARAYDLIGGEAAVDRLVEAFYGHMDTLEAARAIRAMHAPDLSAIKAALKLYLGEWLGGPPLYSQQRGHPRLRMRHFGFSIGTAERDAWMLCMSKALDEVVTDDAIRRQLHTAFASLASHMRNRPDG